MITHRPALNWESPKSKVFLFDCHPPLLTLIASASAEAVSAPVSTRECHNQDSERAKRQCEGQHPLDGQRHSTSKLLYILPCPGRRFTFLYNHPQMMSVR